jgi:CoA-dependent NAD(P)H sulfur oxidoreductase
MRRHRVRRVAIVGGGYMGLEAAEGFCRADCQVTVIEKGSHVLGGYPADFQTLTEERLRAAGVVLHCHSTVRAVATDRQGAVKVLTLESGASVKTDLVIVAAGVVPNAELLLAAGAVAGPGGSVLTDDRLRTSLPGVFAAGVCAAIPHVLTGEPAWFAQAAPAFRSGTIAGHNAAAGASGQRRVSVLETALLRIFDCVVGRTGLADAAAVRFLGSRRALGRIELSVPSRDGYFRDPAPLLLRLLYARPDGRILGAQVFGTDGVDKLVDTLATAITASMTIAQLAEVDLAYCPPLAPLPGIIARLPRPNLGSENG